jgi:hypothetical protein
MLTIARNEEDLQLGVRGNPEGKRGNSRGTSATVTFPETE